MKKKRGRALESRSVLRSASSDVSFMVVYAGLKVSNEQKTKEKTGASVSRMSRKLFGPQKPFVKLPTACFGKPIF